MLILRRNNNYSNWLSNLFNDTFFDTDVAPQTRTTAPAINVKETANEYIMEMAVPGLKKEWVRVNITNDGLLHVAIENKMEHKEENKDNHNERHIHYLRREFSYGNYEQSYTLPEDVNHEKISASVDNGILTIVIPKTTPEQEAKVLKNIEVK